MKTTILTIEVILMLGFVISANAYCWGKPYTPAVVIYVPWWSWTMLAVVLVIEFTREWMERKNDE